MLCKSLIRLFLTIAIILMLSETRASAGFLGIGHGDRVDLLLASSSGGGVLSLGFNGFSDLAGLGLQDVSIDPVSGDLFVLLRDGAGGGAGATVLLNPQLGHARDASTAPPLAFSVLEGSNIAAYNGTLAIAHAERINLFEASSAGGGSLIEVRRFRRSGGLRTPGPLV